MAVKKKAGETAGTAQKNNGKTSRFDAKLARLLSHSASAFASQGYEEASIRQISKVSGFSLAGVYHYVKCKEDLLFLIQYHTFEALVENLEKIIEGDGAPEEQLKEMISGHVDYLSLHLPDLKVCTIEMESLKGDYYRRVLERRQRYFELTRGILQRLKDSDRGSRLDTGVAALFLFGMLNWIVMWFDPKRNSAADLSKSVYDLFLEGFRKSPARVQAGARKRVER